MPHQQHFTPEVHEEPDPWHRHLPDEGDPQEEHGGKPNNFLLAIAFVFSLGFVAATILASFLYFQVYMTGVRQKTLETTVLSTDFLDYREKAHAALAGYSFPTADMARAGKAMIPADQAAQRVIARYSGGAEKK
jgi:hypothetical protein